MSRRQSPNLTNYFSGAKQSQQLSEAESEIQQLKAEIEQLRQSGSVELETQLASLREQLQTQSGILEISLEHIEPNPEQPRQTFLPKSIESMSRSLLEDGQLEPVILIQRENLVLFDGERRWRSAQKLGWKQLRAVIIAEPKALHRKALLTSLHREDLNPLDKAEAIVREIATNTQLEPQNIPRVLSTVVRRLNKHKLMSQVVELMTKTQEEQQQGLLALGLEEKEHAILGLLLNLQLNPASIDANIFPMLSLAEEIKIAMRQLGLLGVHAMALGRLSAKNLQVTEKKAQDIREQAIQQVLEQKLSVSATRKLVRQIIATHSHSSLNRSQDSRQVSKAKVDLQKLSSEMFTKVEVEQLQELQAVLRQKLAEISTVLQNR